MNDICRTAVTAMLTALVPLACRRDRESGVATTPPLAASPAPAGGPDERHVPASPPVVGGERLQLDEGVFALANAGGSELIALNALSRPALIRDAVCAGARVVPVSYARRQVGRPDSATRQTAYTFAYLAGDVYRVVAGAADSGTTCYLSSDSTLLTAVIRAPSAPARGCDSSFMSGLAAAKSRHVVGCWSLAKIGPDVAVALAQFAIRDTSALASLVVFDHGQLLFQDFAARYSGPGTDTWRADDNGVFSPDGFTILFFARIRGTDVLALTWAGSEGENADLLVADSAGAFRTASSSYRYWVPQ